MTGAAGALREAAGSDPVILDLPFRRRWMARNSPARRVPSHGTHRFAVTYAVDFIAVGDDGRPAPRSWRTLLSVGPPEAFRGFGESVLAPAPGVVVDVHDGAPDHEARRSQITLLGHALGQAGRVPAGAAAIAGNHVVIALGPNGPWPRGRCAWGRATWSRRAIGSARAATPATAPSPTCIAR